MLQGGGRAHADVFLMSGLQGWNPRSSVDWYQLDRELNSVPSDFRATRFDSLKHVVEILGSVDPKDTVEDLKDSKRRLEALIDQVVDVYHNGFNLAIQNYSQILQLFTESRDQVDTLRMSLMDGRRRLGAQSRLLRQQWSRSVQLDCTSQILEDVQAVVDVPAKIDAFQMKKDWPQAVGVLIEGCGRVCREELTKIHGLRKIKDDLGARWKMLQAQITGEIQHRVYETEIKDLQGVHPLAARGHRLPHRRLGSSSAGHTPRHSHNPSLGSESSLRGSSFSLRRRLSETEGLEKDEVSVTLSIRDLVDCLAQMGSIQELKETISRTMATKVKGAIVRSITSIESGKGTQSDGALGASVAGSTLHGVSIPPEVSIATQNLLQCVSARVYQILLNLVQLFEVIARADAAGESSAVQFIRTQIQEQQNFLTVRLSQASSLASTQLGQKEELQCLRGGRYLDAACLDAWKCTQGEVLQLVAELLSVPLRQLDKRRNEDQSWLARLDTERAGKTKAKSGEAERKSKMTFSFGLAVTGGGPACGERPGANSGEKDSLTYSQLVRQALNHPGGTYLTPTLYKVVMRFVENCQKAMQEALERFEVGMAEQSEALQKSRLSDFIENFVMESFLPQVWVDFRGRLTAALEDPEAFRPQTRTRTSSKKVSPDMLPGDSVLKSANIAQRMVKEVSGWVPNVPPFASSLTGVIENILGRVQDAFTASVASALGDTTCGKLAANPDLIMLMAQESDAALLPDPAMFYILGAGDTLELPTGLSPAPSPTPSSAESDQAENEIIRAVLAARPVNVEDVMARPGQFGRMVQLATLSNSLELIAASISGLVRKSEVPSSPHSSTTASDTPVARPKVKKSRQISVVWSEGLSGSLSGLMDRYRALAGLCIRALRLEMICLAAHHLDELTSISHLCEEDDRREVPAGVGYLIRHAARAEEEIAPYLPLHKRKYMMSILPSVCAKVCLWLVPQVKEINSAGVERMNRVLSVLQPALSSFLSPVVGGSFRAFDHVRAYYSMLNLSVEDLLAYVGERGGRFSPIEWKALLEVHVPGRWVSEEHINTLDKILETRRVQSIAMSGKNRRGARH
ncbi:hypothetical protein BSKO_03345 [Bryopsis sp. KO-2023]|nr:hypothetical protein BSKO_03345 [Bryopsis sp. KO-2023]